MRELDGLSDAPMGDSSNATDDGFASLLTQSSYTSVRKEPVDFFGSMNDDEQRELIALYPIGGVDFPVEERPARSPRRRTGGRGRRPFSSACPMLPVNWSRNWRSSDFPARTAASDRKGSS
jgi:hypothetical protein